MRNRLPVPRKTILLALGLLATAATVRADITLVETVDVVPTSVVALPRTYYVPSSYVTTSSVIVPSSATASIYDLTPTAAYVPTSSYVPTRYYVPTSTYVPTSYYATSYVYRRPFRRNRYVETTYLSAPSVALTPTYYVPTATYVPTGIVTSSLCCETAAPMVVQAAPAAPARSSRAAIEPLPERGNGGTIESSVVGEPDEQLAPVGGSATTPVPPVNTPRDRSAKPSNSGSNPSNSGGNTTGAGATNGGATGAAAVPNTATRDSRGAPGSTAPPTGNTGGATGSTGSPVSPAGSTGGVQKGSTSPLPKQAAPPAESSSPPPRTEPDAIPPPVPSPAAPADPLSFPSVDDAGRRSSYKPVVVPPIEPRPKLAQNVLRGRVVADDTRMPEVGVEVILVDRLNRFSDRSTRTDALGRFALNIPEGDWSIFLVMPSGRALPVEQGLVTASAGKVSDRWGRELTDLVLSR